MEGPHSDEFMMNSYKVELCMLSHPHVWKSCPYVHPGEPIKRRPHSNHHPDLCPDVKKGRMCSYGPEKCYWAHNTFESWLHPERFRTMMCRDGSKCSRPICFFAHSQAQLRRPTPAAHRPPPPSPGTSSFSATAMPCQQQQQQQQQQQFYMPQAAAGAPRPVVPPAAVVPAGLNHAGPIQELSAPALISPPPPEGMTMSAAVPNWVQHMQPVGGAAGGLMVYAVSSSSSDCSSTGCIGPFEFHRGLAPVSAAVAPALGVAGMANLNQHQVVVQHVLNQQQQQVLNQQQQQVLNQQQQQQQQRQQGATRLDAAAPAGATQLMMSVPQQGLTFNHAGLGEASLPTPIQGPMPLPDATIVVDQAQPFAGVLTAQDPIAVLDRAETSPGDSRLHAFFGGNVFTPSCDSNLLARGHTTVLPCSCTTSGNSSETGSPCSDAARRSSSSSGISTCGSHQLMLFESPLSPAAELELQQLAADLPASLYGLLQLA